MGDRLLVAARKSRKGDAAEDDQYKRQEDGAAAIAARDGHVIVATVRDTVSSQRPPWERRELRKWMDDGTEETADGERKRVRDPSPKLPLFDGILVTETDRLARLDDEGWHDIESWCYRNGKSIVTGEGVRFPAREGNDGDYWQWHALKKQARRYWEQTRDKQAGGRAIAKASGGFIGSVPFGYAMSGVKYHKKPVPHPENGPLAVELFTRIAGDASNSPQSGATVAAWLTQATGRLWRVKAVLGIVRNRTYLGERDGTTFDPLVTQELWDAANASLAARSFTRAAAPAIHGFSGRIYCARCQTVMYRHKPDRGREVYRCGLGRRGVIEARCGMPGVSFDAVNDSVHAVMAALMIPEQAQRASGGDSGKAAELVAIKRKMSSALAKNDMPLLAMLSAEYTARESRESEPVKVWWQPTGRTLAQAWEAGDLKARRELLREDLRSHGLVLVITADGTAELADIVEKPDVRTWDGERNAEVTGGQWAAAKAALDAEAA
jgi:DNA invertase Pin-like site-specific DNA recombinase